MTLNLKKNYIKTRSNFRLYILNFHLVTIVFSKQIMRTYENVLLKSFTIIGFLGSTFKIPSTILPISGLSFYTISV